MSYVKDGYHYNDDGTPLLNKDGTHRKKRPGNCTKHLRPHQWKPGQSGNPGGKSRQQVAIERRNAELATDIRTRLLEDMARKIEEGDARIADSDETEDSQCDSTMFLNPDLLKLLSSSEDRGLGKPVTTLQVEQKINADVTVDWSKMDPATLLEIRRLATLKAEENSADTE